MTSEEDEEESEPKEICRITQINKRLPDNNDHYGIELKINETEQQFTPLIPTLRSPIPNIQRSSENTNKIQMLSNTTKSTTKLLSPTRRPEKRTRPTN